MIVGFTTGAQFSEDDPSLSVVMFTFDFHLIQHVILLMLTLGLVFAYEPFCRKDELSVHWKCK
jgi:hypothetical protein